MQIGRIGQKWYRFRIINFKIHGSKLEITYLCKVRYFSYITIINKRYYKVKQNLSFEYLQLQT